MALSDRRRRFATMLLWETITGGDVRFANGRQKPIDRMDRQEYASFRKECGPALTDYMAREGERLLLYNNINEPVTWHPEPKDPTGQAWNSPPANMTRHLPGWQAPSRQVRRWLPPHRGAFPTLRPSVCDAPRSGQLAIEWPDR
jgi:hypothetical protein